MATFNKLMTGGSRALRTYRVAASSSGAGTAAAAPRADGGPQCPLLTSHLPPTAAGGLYPSEEAGAPFVVGRRQAAWIDDATNYCHLCAAHMTHGKSFHMGFDRDHISLNAFVYLSAMFPRTWNPESVHRRALAGCLRPLGHFALIGAREGRLVTMNALNAVPTTPDDVYRVETLRALLLHLLEGPSDVRTLFVTPYDDAPPGLVGQGEKIFRARVTEIVAALFPPLGPNIQAAFSQKAWGRTNLMLLYDRMGWAEIDARYGNKPKSNRSDKSAVMRQMIVELSLASASHTDRPPTAAALADLAVHRLAFEAVVQKSAHYMHQAQQAIAYTDYPNPHQLQEHDFT
jgi:hypothetical protein